jgi:hypothetical protein
MKIPVSPDCPDSSLLFKSPYFCLAHLSDITVLLFVFQSDESALTEISLSAVTGLLDHANPAEIATVLASTPPISQ